jgi:hypothetical protein
MLPVSVGFLLGLLSSPEVGSDMFLGNIRVSLKLHGITNQKTALFSIHCQKNLKTNSSY